MRFVSSGSPGRRDREAAHSSDALVRGAGKHPTRRARGAAAHYGGLDEAVQSIGRNLQGIEERIRTRAYQLYEQRGNRGGSAVEDWLQAESEIMEPQELRVAA